MENKLRILVIEDSENDAELLIREVKRHGYEVEFERVETSGQMKSALADSTWDLILCDYYLPTFNAPAALEVLKDCGYDIPFIIASRSVGEETAVHALKTGAHDFVVKDRLARLVPAIERELKEVEERRQRKRAEETLRESEQKFSIIFDKAPLATALSTLPEGIIVNTNEAFERVFGYTQEETVGRTSLDLGINPDAEARARIAAELEARGSVRDVELALNTKAGATRIFSVNLDVIRIGDQKYILQTAQDITERMQADHALRESEERFRKVLDSMLEGFQIIGFDWKYLYINDAGAMQGRRSKLELEGHTMMEMYPGIEQTALFTALRRCMEDRTPQSMENEFIYPDGSHAWFELVIQPVTDGIFILSTDITARKRAESNMLNLNVELEQRVLERTAQLAAANKELEAFSYSVSHDLRAPLRGINGFSDALMQEFGGQLSEDALHYLSRIRENTRRMGQLIDDLLELARVTRRELSHERVDLGALVREIASDLRGQEPGRQVNFIVAEPAQAQGDPHLLRIALQNLLANAWKFTSPREPAHIEFGVTEREGRQIFYIRDDGVGFDMQHASKLFGAFQRLHMTSEFPGTGIGLATVQRIIHRHGGEIWAEAETGKGATFYFTLGGTQ